MNRELLNSGVNEVVKVTQQILDDIMPHLNFIHQTNNQKKHWNIILGHWLQRYVGFLYYIYHSDDYCQYGYHSLDHKFFKGIIKKDSYSFITATNDFQYQQQIRALLKIYKNGEKLPDFNYIYGYSGEDQSSMENRSKSGFKKTINKILTRFYQEREIVLINTYLPRYLEIGLQISIRQVPKFWEFPDRLNEKKINLKLREIFSNIELKDNSSCFYNFCFKLIPYSIPQSFIESYEELLAFAHNVKMPKYPRVIFTSNNFDTDEYFKVWAVEKIKTGTRYIVGQHGNNYGSHFYYGNNTWPERSSADCFITWGWSNNHSEIPAFNFKVPYQMRKKNSLLSNTILVIAQSCDNQVVPWDTKKKYDLYLYHLNKLVRKLLEYDGIKIQLRFHKQSKQIFKILNLESKLNNKNVILDFQHQKLSKIKLKSRLIIYTYDSTGILESLNYDEPFICYFNEGINHIDHSVVSYYQKLIDAKIIHTNLEDCERFINDVWDNIYKWWVLDVTIKAKTEFKEYFSRTTKSPIRDLINILNRY